MEKAEPTIMEQQPRDPDEGIFTGRTLIAVTYRGIIIAAMVIIAQWLGLQHSTEMGVAMAFSTLIWCRTLQTFPARSNTQTALKAGLFANQMVWLAVGLSGALYSLTLLPGVRGIFSIPTSFGMEEIGLCLGLAALAMLLMELMKLILVRLKK